VEPREDKTRPNAEKTGNDRAGAFRFSCDELVGAHTDTLRDMFAAAPPADPDDLGDAPRGRLLGLQVTSDVHLMLRPVVKLVSQRLVPWQGIVFDHGGNAGANVIFGREVQRFRARVGASRFDAKPSLVLSYDALGWPLSALSDELRSIGPGNALGATFVGNKLVAWFGLVRPGEKA
jgi:hypothetical protein